MVYFNLILWIYIIYNLFLIKKLGAKLCTSTLLNPYKVINVVCKGHCCNLNGTTIDEICCSKGSHHVYEIENSHSIGYWLAFIPVTVVCLLCCLSTCLILFCIFKANHLGFRRRQMPPIPQYLDPQIYNINPNLENTSNLPSTLLNFNDNASQPPKYEEIMLTTESLQINTNNNTNCIQNNYQNESNLYFVTSIEGPKNIKL